ncbi:MAG TPA: single-stranded DNA-binding protein [Syntrophales bacterium]|nr:single-stranded DNA-binding protein [Syntrophales bacterium]
MNKLFIIGSLGKDPEIRTTSSGINVCNFNVAVTERKGQEKVTTWFRVTAWRGLADLCQKYLAKGRKVCVTGSVSVSTYEGKDGTTRASLEVTADEVEFLSPMERGDADDTRFIGKEQDGFTQVDEDDLPF